MPEEIEPEFLPTQRSDIYVVPNLNAVGAFLVVPGIFGVPPAGGTIWIRNLSGKPIEVTVPTSIGGTGRPETIQNKQPKQFTLAAATVDTYPYSVAVDLGGGTKVPAQGGSDPRIVYG